MTCNPKSEIYNPKQNNTYLDDEIGAFVAFQSPNGQNISNQTTTPHVTTMGRHLILFTNLVCSVFFILF